MAQKLQSSLAVEGELPEDGLAAYGDEGDEGDEGDDLMLALARKIVAGDEDTDSVESAFAQAQRVAAEAEALLVDEGWQVPATSSGRCSRGPSSWPRSRRREPQKPQRRDEAPTLSLFEWALSRRRRACSWVRARRTGSGETSPVTAVSPASPHVWGLSSLTGVEEFRTPLAAGPGERRRPKRLAGRGRLDAGRRASGLRRRQRGPRSVPRSRVRQPHDRVAGLRSG